MKRVLIGAVAASALLLTGVAQASADLAKNNGCLNCHTVETKLVGPSLKEIAAKYADKADAVDYLTGKITGGSSGVWGTMAMPPKGGSPSLSDADAKTLAEFIMTLK